MTGRTRDRELDAQLRALAAMLEGPGGLPWQVQEVAAAVGMARTLAEHAQAGKEFAELVEQARQLYKAVQDARDTYYLLTF